MTWSELIPLITRYSIAGAYEIWRILQSNPVPTEEAWQKLLEVNRRSLQSYVEEQAKILGVPAPPPPGASVEPPASITPPF